MLVKKEDKRILGLSKKLKEWHSEQTLALSELSELMHSSKWVTK